MCPCSLLLFVHIWKYFNSYTRCCFQHLVYKTRIKMGKCSVIWRSRAHAQVYICIKNLTHIGSIQRTLQSPFLSTWSILLHKHQLWLNNAAGFTPVLTRHDAALRPNRSVLRHRSHLLPLPTSPRLPEGAQSAASTSRETSVFPLKGPRTPFSWETSFLEREGDPD